MNYLAIILVSSITFGSTFLAVKQGWVGNSLNGNKLQEVEAASDEVDTTESIFNNLKKPISFAPVKIDIGNGLIYIERLGLKPDGGLEDPEKWENAGWYKKGAKVGEDGNMIIAGHYDDTSAKPAAFWGLKNLKVNDKVHVVDELNRTFTYNITEIFYVDIDDPSRLEIFEDSELKELTLITCGGLWNDAKGTYSSRLVVKAELVDSSR